MCISVQPGSKNNPGSPGEAGSSLLLMLVLFIDLRGLLNLVGSFLLGIFHNVHRWLRRPRAASQHFIDPAAKQTCIYHTGRRLLADMTELSSLMTTGIDGSHEKISSAKLITVSGSKGPLRFQAWCFIAHQFKFSALGGLFIRCMIQLVFWEGLTENTYSKMTKESGFGIAPGWPYPSE